MQNKITNLLFSDNDVEIEANDTTRTLAAVAAADTPADRSLSASIRGTVHSKRWSIVKRSNAVGILQRVVCWVA